MKSNGNTCFKLMSIFSSIHHCFEDCQLSHSMAGMSLGAIDSTRQACFRPPEVMNDDGFLEFPFRPLLVVHEVQVLQEFSARSKMPKAQETVLSNEFGKVLLLQQGYPCLGTSMFTKGRHICRWYLQ